MQCDLKTIEQVLAASGAQLLRQRKHRIYGWPSGHRWTVPSTPSDCRAYQNNLAHLRRFLSRHPFGLRSSATPPTFPQRTRPTLAPTVAKPAVAASPEPVQAQAPIVSARKRIHPQNGNLYKLGSEIQRALAKVFNEAAIRGVYDAMLLCMLQEAIETGELPPDAEPGPILLREKETTVRVVAAAWGSASRTTARICQRAARQALCGEPIGASGLRREIKTAVRKHLERAICQLPEFYRSFADLKGSTWRSARICAQVAFPIIEEFCSKEGVQVSLAGGEHEFHGD